MQLTNCTVDGIDLFAVDCVSFKTKERFYF